MRCILPNDHLQRHTLFDPGADGSLRPELVVPHRQRRRLGCKCSVCKAVSCEYFDVATPLNPQAVVARKWRDKIACKVSHSESTSACVHGIPPRGRGGTACTRVNIRWGSIIKSIAEGGAPTYYFTCNARHDTIHICRRDARPLDFGNATLLVRIA